MATITLTLSAAALTRAVTALSTRFGYQANIYNNATPPILIPNPQTPQEFVRQLLISWIINNVKEHEGNTAAAVAKATNDTDVANNILIT